MRIQILDKKQTDDKERFLDG